MTRPVNYTTSAAGMVPLDEIMLPYLVVGPERVLRDDYRERRALTVGGES